MKRIQMKLSKYLLIIFLGLYGCNTGAPRPINYGEEGCHYCKMTVVDKIHGAELITKKGKIYTFDALECMINYIQTNETEQNARYLTNVYEEPGSFFDVEDAIFLISENLPSPMGGNLTAFRSPETAEKVLSEKQGILYSWEELMDRSHTLVRY